MITIFKNTFGKYLLALLVLCGVACTQKLYDRLGTSVVSVAATESVNPVFTRQAINPCVRIEVNIPKGHKELNFNAISGIIGNVSLGDIERIELYKGNEKPDFTGTELLGSVIPTGKKFTIPFESKPVVGQHIFWVSLSLKTGANTAHKITLNVEQLTDKTGVIYKINQRSVTAKYIGIGLRLPKDENVHTYRIPGMITTDKGTLIAVYDIRYDDSRDLPANIDVGMSRSTNGGQSWGEMKNIIDMEGPKDNSGAGDPCVLFDPVTKTIYVAALWSKGNRSIAGSGPGLSPEETGQFVITSSTDDGLTWTKPYSITSQVKNPEWRLFFPGPGNGIAMTDGKLVFPAQYWDAQKMPHATLIYSDDHGKSWKSGIGAKSNTTESQLVETAQGTLMLNMRDNRGGFRSIATTADFGKSWQEHATSRNTLQEPVCMAAFIKAKVMVKGHLKDVLFFCNPNDSKSRKDITIKASLDMGETWLPVNQLLVDSRNCYGYSALTKVDDHTVGLLYEGVGSLLFVKIPVKDIIK
uniref:sialidase family protein n=1 Tax=Pedobacter schmidteae TaxID=2201271 RepID=UPI000EB44A87|nr:sialidase family protein [Pedobacter schmidteae]